MLNRILTIVFCILNFVGCVTSLEKETIHGGLDTPGIYHRIESGQTLWGISRLYGVDLNELARINRIYEPASVETGRTIFIPGQKNSPIQEAKVESFIFPLKGKIISNFGKTYQAKVNKGIDIEPARNLKILASRGGKVEFCEEDFGNFGKTIIIDHGDGFSSVYARNKELVVSLGEQVKKGQVIAKAGSAGRDRNVFLHFQIRKDGIAQNPIFFLSKK